MPDDPQNLSPAQARRIDTICAAFETAFRHGDEPTVEAFAVDSPSNLQPHLRRELASLHDDLVERAARERDGEGLPTSIGGYRILRSLGEGGMGTVYEAVQTATRQRVALKVVRTDLRSDRMRRRFEREVRVLGHLHHPGIAQLFDAGVDETADPRHPTPYLVMELLHGRPLLAHATHHDLGVRDRLELVRRVCAAVQHAHDQGIVHRDLKPANILVTEPTGTTTNTDTHAAIGVPKVLDFGVARALSHHEDLQSTLETRSSQLVGTISHMSPEQLDGDPDLVDARADVYALGVILYQLLAGRLPLDVRSSSLPAAIEQVRTAEPEPLGRVDARLRGDVEVIVQKALEKEPARRYQSADELADEIARHLEDLPIRARPASTIYRLRKFARRNRGLFQGLVAAVTVLLVSLVVVALFAVRQAQQREDAETRQRIEAAVSEFLTGMLKRANLDEVGNSRDTRLYDVLLAAEQEIETAYARDPAARAAVRRTIGAALLSQAEYARAERQFVRARDTIREVHGEHSRDMAIVEQSLALTHEAQDRLDEAEQGLRRALAIWRQLRPIEPDRLAGALNDLAACLELRGEFVEAETLHRESLATSERVHGPDSVEVSTSCNNLGSLLERTGDYAGAEPMYRNAIRIRRLLPQPNRKLATAINNLAVLQTRRSRLEEAQAGLEESLRIAGQLLDPGHPELLARQASLAAVMAQRGDAAHSAELYEQLIPALAARRGEHHTEVDQLRINQSFVLVELGRLQEAHDLTEQVVGRFGQHLGEDHEQTLWGLTHLSDCCDRLGQRERARSLLEEVLRRRERSLGAHAKTAAALANLGRFAAEHGDADAVELLRRSIVACDAHIGHDGRDRISSRIWLLRHLTGGKLATTPVAADSADEARALVPQLRELLQEYRGGLRQTLLDEVDAVGRRLPAAR